MVEKISRHCILKLKSDNGGEFTSLTFKSYCSTHGIQKQFSQPYTPQHNGLAERKNWTLLNIVQCFLIDSQLPQFLWAEAVQATCTIINLQPSKQQLAKTPEELFSGHKPDISKLRIFGIMTYVFDTNPKKSKLDPRSRQCFHLSFDFQVKGYRCYDPKLKKVIISKHIHFIESAPLASLPSHEVSSIQLPLSPVTGPFVPGPSMDIPPSCAPDLTPVLAPPSLAESLSSAEHANLVSPLQSPPQILFVVLPQPALPRRSTRHRKAHHDYIPSNLLDSFIGNLELGGEPLTYQQVLADLKWLPAMVFELCSLQKNHT